MPPFTHTYLYEPGTDPAAAPLLLLHGTGGSENELLPLGRQLSPGAALLSPRGNVLEGGAPRFFRRFAEGVFDFADLARRVEELADFIAAAARHHGFDAARLTAVGFSNGANMAASLLMLRPESLAAALLLRPMVVLQPASVPPLTGKRVLISSGQFDPITPVDHPERLARLLREAGAEVEVCVHAASHGLVQADHVAAQRFLADVNSR